MVYIIYETVQSTYDAVIVVFCAIYWVLLIPVDTSIPVFNIIPSFVKVDEFTNCVPFHRKISPLLIDVILVSISKLWVKFVLAHFEHVLYINAWLVAGDEIEQSVLASNVDDTDSYIIYTSGNSLYYPVIQALKYFDDNLTAAIASGGTYITSPTYGYNSLANPCTNCRINIDYGFTFASYAFNLTMSGAPFGNWYNIWLYGSNNASDFNDVTDIIRQVLYYIHLLIQGALGRRPWPIFY